MVDDVEDRIIEIGTIISLADHAAESIALKLSNKETLDHRLAFEVMASFAIIKKKLDGIVTAMYEYKEKTPEAA
jgi:hypothetical protein